MPADLLHNIGSTQRSPDPLDLGVLWSGKAGRGKGRAGRGKERKGSLLQTDRHH